MTPPNILLITCDQMRFDAIAAHGNPYIETPNLDRLIAEGTTFRRAYAESPVCVPARAITLTGRLPHRTGVFDNSDALGTQVLTFASLLHDAGYFAQAIGKMHFRPVRASHGFDRLWLSEERPQRASDDDYLTELLANGYSLVLEPHGVRHELYYSPQPSQLPADQTTTAWTGRRTTEFLRERAATGQPFLCWTSFIKPHPPFDPPAPWYLRYDPLRMPPPVRVEAELESLTHHVHRQHRFKWTTPDIDIERVQVIRAYYYALVSFVDHWIGRILDTLDSLGLRENTLIVFTADHGEYLGDHWAFGKRGFHDSAARIPLVMSLPSRIPAGGVVDALVGLADLAPTICSAAGIDSTPLAYDGHNLMPLARGDVTAVRDRLLGQLSRGPTGLYLSMDDHHKYIFSAADDREFLLRVGSDETCDLRDQPGYATVAAELRAALHERFRRNGYDEPLHHGGWRHFAIPPAGTNPPDERGRQYPLWQEASTFPT